jgi:uncharacterized protein YggE
MNMKSTRRMAWALLAFCLSLCAPAFLQAQLVDTGESGVISGTGTTIIKQTPDFMRMHVQLSATGKTLKEALAKLAETRTSAMKQLAELGATKDSIKVEGPKPSALSSQQQQMMAMVLRQRGRGAKPTAADKPQTSTITLAITADWPLKGKSTEELLLEADALQTKIKAANVAQVGETELTPEEQELAEEMEEMTQNNYGEEQTEKPGTPSFAFVKKIDSEAIAAATKKAFAKAEENAALLSKAAGTELGPLRQLSSQSQVVNSNDPYSRMSGMYQYYAMQQAEQDEVTEAIGMDVSEVQVTVRVHAAFGLKE